MFVLLFACVGFFSPFLYITHIIMKFTVLDGRTDARAHYTDTYTYLDDLLDKTFLTDYFLDRTTPAEATTTSASASVP